VPAGQELNLAELSALLAENPAFRELEGRLLEGHAGAVVSEAAKPFVIAAVSARLDLPMLVISPTVQRAKKLYEQLLIWCPREREVQLFPEAEVLPYERLSLDRDVCHQRLRILKLLALGAGRPPLIVASARAVARRTIPRERFLDCCHVLRRGDRVEMLRLQERWQSLGYVSRSTVEVPGEMGRRGGILDIFPPDAQYPFRLEFWGDEVEDIRIFDPGTQRSLGPASEAGVIPAREMLPDPAAIAEFLARGPAPEFMVEELGRLAGGETFPGDDFYAPIFNRGSLLDYLPGRCLLVLDEPAEVLLELEEFERRALEVRERRRECGELPPHFPSPLLSPEEARARWEALPLLEIRRWGEGVALPFRPPSLDRGRWQPLVEALREKLKEGRRVILTSYQSQRLAGLLREEGLPFDSDTGGLPAPGVIKLYHGTVAEGWELEQPPALLLGDGELFGLVKERRQTKVRPVRREAFLSDINPGDYVVHVEHGIGRYLGMARMSLEGEEKEYLVLEYAEGARLYVPVELAERVTRYIGVGQAPPLSRLRSGEWQRTKERVKRAVDDLARELLEIYAAREVIPGFAFPPDGEWQWQLEASFPYVETPDQLRTVAEVKRDMEKAAPMDRLICGDVGYGKTEVALRAAFKAVMGGKQVAVLVPTTVLAQQHYNTFARRLAPFPVRTAMLSRFLSEQEQREVIKGLAAGTIDICIGTHRLLQRDVRFKDLGLVIVDEEQRFGVRHKEWLKRLRREVDVLTLSATPIPRTLYMSLIGIKDMSVMETPPEERLPVKVYVGEYSDSLVREAVLRELERGGQVFFVHNRVETIYSWAARLADLVPEARIAVAHGRMDEAELELVMTEFVDGEKDILVCTTIIESGLDLPNVNTLIVTDAERLGLTQLYQLRGRVGRGSETAYAYFLYPSGKKLTPQAIRRLETIHQAGELGAGFHIAMRDLEIRGAGNLLGREQSGHIGAVGFELYCRLLARAVEELKAKREGRPLPPSYPPPPCSLPLSAYIPEEYVPDPQVRLELYHRLSAAAGLEELEDLARELKDRFGPLPPPVEALLYTIRIRLLGALAGVESIDREDGYLVVRLRGRKKLEPYIPGLMVGSRLVKLDLRALSDWARVLEEVLTRMATGS